MRQYSNRDFFLKKTKEMEGGLVNLRTEWLVSVSTAHLDSTVVIFFSD